MTNRSVHGAAGITMRVRGRLRSASPARVCCGSLQDVCGAGWPAEQEALDFGASLGAELVQLRLRFHALGCRCHVEAGAQADHCADDVDGVGAAGEVADEGLVDLDFIEGKAAEVAEGGVSGTEIVHGDAAKSASCFRRASRPRLDLLGMTVSLWCESRSISGWWPTTSSALKVVDPCSVTVSADAGATSMIRAASDAADRRPRRRGVRCGVVIRRLTGMLDLGAVYR